MPIPKKTRDIAMKIILDFHNTREPGHSIGPLYLAKKGLPEGTDPIQVIEVLRSMGYITYTKERNGKIYDIRPTDVGIHYFETTEDEKAERKKIFAHEWKIAVFSALAGALLSQPLWSFIEWVVGLINFYKSSVQ